jgi:hypothetical protein
MRDPHDPWQDELADAAPTPQLTPTETELRRAAINDCPHCDPDGYRGTTVCDHRNENPAQTAARHLAHIRAQMGWNTPAGTTTPDTPQKPAHDQAGPQE